MRKKMPADTLRTEMFSSVLASFLRLAQMPKIGTYLSSGFLIHYICSIRQNLAK